MRPNTRLVSALALSALAAGCSTQPSGREAYDQALAQWQGAPEETLRARWGKPIAEEQIDHGKWLTYFVSSGTAPAPTMSFSIGGFGFGGGRKSVGGGVGVTAPIGQPTTVGCTTRFLVENGKVTTWNFEGPGCGASN